MSFISSTFLPSCFRLLKTTDNDSHQSPPSSAALSTTVTSYIYQTDSGAVSLTWSRSILGRSLQFHLQNHPSFHLHIKPFLFWNKNGSKKISSNTTLSWNLSNASFGSEPEPHSRFHLTLTVNNNLTTFHVGDLLLAPKFKAQQKPKPNQLLLLKRDHVHVAPHHHRVYQTKMKFHGKDREIEIDCNGFGFGYGYGDVNGNDNDVSLLFGVDGERVLEVKRLKWKFRGSQRVEIDGCHVQISWDVHDWFFEKENNCNNEGHAVFVFKFEDDDARGKEVMVGEEKWNLGSCCEWGKNGKSWSSSSLSLSFSAGSSGGSSSVMEWSSVEENELVVPPGFSLIVYAWRR